MLVSAQDLALELLREWNSGWAADLMSLGTSVPHSSFYTLCDEGTLKFCHCTNDLKHQAPSGSREVQVVAQADKGDSSCLQFSERVY